MAETTDFVFARAWMRVLLADTLVRSDQPAAASDLAAEALAMLDAKGDVTGAARLREHLDRLGIARDS